MKFIANSMGFEVTFERIPIRDGWVASHGDMVAILDSIDSHVEKGKANLHPLPCPVKCLRVPCITPMSGRRGSGKHILYPCTSSF